MKKILLVSIVVFLSCNKDHNQTSKQRLLTNKKWQLVALIDSFADGTSNNRYDSLPKYETDDYFIFYDDGVLVEYDNKILWPLTTHSDTVVLGNWYFSGTNQEFLHRTTQFSNESDSLIELNNIEMKSKTDGPNHAHAFATYKVIP